MTPTLTPRQAELLRSLPRDDSVLSETISASKIPYTEWNDLWHAGIVTGEVRYLLTEAGRALWDELNKEKSQ